MAMSMELLSAVQSEWQTGLLKVSQTETWLDWPTELLLAFQTEMQSDWKMAQPTELRMATSWGSQWVPRWVPKWVLQSVLPKALRTVKPLELLSALRMEMESAWLTERPMGLPMEMLWVLPMGLSWETPLVILTVQQMVQPMVPRMATLLASWTVLRSGWSMALRMEPPLVLQWVQLKALL